MGSKKWIFLCGFGVQKMASGHYEFWSGPKYYSHFLGEYQLAFLAKRTSARIKGGG
jgi:hypothetical protein